MIYNWCKYAVKIGAYANKDRDHDGDKDGFVDVKNDVTKTPEEEYERDVDKPGHELRDRWQALGAFEQIQPNPRSPQRVSGLLEDAHISPSPLLDQRREEGGRQTAYEANEPVNIDPAV